MTVYSTQVFHVKSALFHFKSTLLFKSRVNSKRKRFNSERKPEKKISIQNENGLNKARDRASSNKSRNEPRSNTSICNAHVDDISPANDSDDHYDRFERTRNDGDKTETRPDGNEDQSIAVWGGVADRAKVRITAVVGGVRRGGMSGRAPPLTSLQIKNQYLDDEKRILEAEKRTTSPSWRRDRRRTTAFAARLRTREHNARYCGQWRFFGGRLG